MTGVIDRPLPLTRALPSGGVTAPIGLPYAEVGPGGRRLVDVLVVAVCSVMAAVLGGWNIRGRSVWFDEAFTVSMARTDWGTFLTATWREELNSFLYYLPLRAVGSSDHVLTWARGLSLVCAVLVVPVVAFIAHRLAGRKAMATAAVLAAVHPALVWYAVEARSYAMAVLLCSLTAACALVARDTARTGWWAAAGAVGAAAVYAHLFGLLATVTVLGVVACFVPRNERRPMVIGVLVYAVALVPAGLFMLQADTAQLQWIASNDRSAVVRTIELIGGGSTNLVLVGACMLLLAGAAAAARRMVLRRTDAPAIAYALPVAWVVAPIVMTVVLNTLMPLFVPRYLMVTLPGLVVLAAVAATALRSRAATTLAVAALVVAGAGALRTTLTDQGAERWDAAAITIAQRATAEDALIVVPGFQRAALEHDLPDTPGPGGFPVVMYPNDIALGDDPIYGGPTGDLSAVRPAADVVWVVIGPMAPDDPLRDEARAAVGDRVLASVTRHGLVSIEQWVQPAGP
jgi:mannosyltransferase